MRSTVIPAQITTVEDKVAGNLGVSQLLLLAAPIFGGSALFVIFPPFFSYAAYKLVLIVCLMSICSVLAIRVKGTIVLRWVMILAGYMLRPRFYVFDKNSDYLREESEPEAPAVAQATNDEVAAQRIPLPRLDPAELVKVQDFMTNPHAQLQFKTNRKGELNVYAAEVQQ
jgi:hypothetical protein